MESFVDGGTQLQTVPEDAPVVYNEDNACLTSEKSSKRERDDCFAKEFGPPCKRRRYTSSQSPLNILDALREIRDGVNLLCDNVDE